jgi:hypothetical protein
MLCFICLKNHKTCRKVILGICVLFFSPAFISELCSGGAQKDVKSQQFSDFNLNWDVKF